jgi:hypothetical protein
MPESLGDGGAATSIKYFVPMGVMGFSATVYVTAQDVCGTEYNYPEP